MELQIYDLDAFLTHAVNGLAGTNATIDFLMIWVSTIGVPLLVLAVELRDAGLPVLASSEPSASVDDLVAAADHDDTVAVFSHGGVINVLLHRILGTERLLSFHVDYASVTRLLSSRTGRLAVAAVNTTEHVWDLLPRNQRW